MAGENELLRMLEPAVRPVGTSAQPGSPRLPIEQQGFDQLLHEASNATSVTNVQELTFSMNAENRISEMETQLSDTQVQIQVLTEAIEQTDVEGTQDSLLLMEQLGTVVNIPNRTVVTVLSKDRINNSIVTNSDSTVLSAAPDVSGIQTERSDIT